MCHHGKGQRFSILYEFITYHAYLNFTAYFGLFSIVYLTSDFKTYKLCVVDYSDNSIQRHIS